MSSAISLSRSPTMLVPTHTYFPASLFRAFVIISFPPRIWGNRRRGRGERLIMDRKNSNIRVWETLGGLRLTQRDNRKQHSSTTTHNFRMSVSIYLPKSHYSTTMKCTHKHIMVYCLRVFFIRSLLCAFRDRDRLSVFAFCRSHSTAIWSLNHYRSSVFLLRVSWAKEHFSQSNTTAVSTFPVATESFGTVFVYIVGNFLKNRFLGILFFVCAHTTTSESKWTCI